MRAVGYCRVGTKGSEQVHSFEAQRGLFEQFAEQNKYELLEIYADLGRSGTSRQTREQLQKLLKDSESDNFDIILIRGIAALSRKPEDLLDIIKTFKENNKKVYFINEKKYADEISELNLVLIDAIEKLTSEDTSKKIKNNRLEK